MRRRNRVSGEGVAAFGGCFGVIVLVALAMSLGPLAFQYVLDAATGRDVPWYADLIAGTILSEIVVRVAIVVWIVKLCGVPTPFFG